MNNPVVTACNCTGEPRSILDEAGQPMLVEGVVVCPRCGRNPFGLNCAAYNRSQRIKELNAEIGELIASDSEGGEA